MNVSFFWEWLSSLNAHERLPLLLMAMFALVCIVMIVFGSLYKMHKNRLDDALKRELLDRGMSADEIATVVRARPMKSEPANEI